MWILSGGPPDDDPGLVYGRPGIPIYRAFVGDCATILTGRKPVDTAVYQHTAGWFQPSSGIAGIPRG